MATIEQLFSVQARQNEIWRRLKSGSLNVDDVLAATQGILDGVYPTPPAHPLPAWYVSPEQQLERVRQLNAERKWGFADADFPAVPSFMPRTPTEVLLLAVYLPQKGKVSGVRRTFDEHLTVIESQLRGTGRDYYRSDGLKSDRDHLQLFGTAWHEPAMGLRWVAYDYAANHEPENGHRVDELWKAKANDLAASEVLSALMLFPEYGPSMDGDKTPYANLAGYQANWGSESDWSCCPCVDWWSGGRQLGVSAGWADGRDYVWASPRFREC